MEGVTFEKPLREGLRLEQTPEPCIAVIFGASGDLTRRKLVPALYSLDEQNLLPNGFSIVGTARTPMSHNGFRQKMKEALHRFSDAQPPDNEVWENFSANVHYTPTDPQEGESFKRLGALLSEIDQKQGTSGNRLFYLSTPPTLYVPIIQMLGKASLNRSTGWTSIIVEKPFGRDLDELWAQMAEVSSENLQQAVMKACVLNLVVYASGPESAGEVGQVIAKLTQEHPGRVMVVHPGLNSAKGALDVMVTAQCHGSTSEKQICCEQIVIRASGPEINHLPSLVSRLLLPDLPVFLWWRDVPDFENILFARLLET